MLKERSKKGKRFEMHQSPHAMELLCRRSTTCLVKTVSKGWNRRDPHQNDCVLMIEINSETNPSSKEISGVRPLSCKS